MKEMMIEISARHAHLTQEAVEILFGKGHTLTLKKELSQPGQYACEEKIIVKGPRNELKMSVLGPVRNVNQIEISLTDARTIGVDAPIRESGDIAGSAPCLLIGPCGELELKEGVIVAKRHIHLDNKDAEEFGVTNGEIVNVKIETPDRTTIFGDVVVRVNDAFCLTMHIDTDEGNACGIKGDVKGEILK